MRSVTCLVLAAFLTGLASSGALAQGRIEGAPIAVDGGAVTGKWVGNATARAYLGIPFAAPPVGDLRWKPPQPVKPWPGVRDATSFGPQCLQPGGSPKSVYFEYSGGDLPMNEDCLTLNVWAPADQAKDLPVMVWIYGGGFQVGAASRPVFNGMRLDERGVIVVSMNYRVGALGFLAHPRASAPESAQHARATTACSIRSPPCRGEAQHPRLRWQSRQRHDFRPVRRRHKRRAPDGLAAGARTVPPRRRREHGPSGQDGRAGRGGDAGQGVRPEARRRLARRPARQVGPGNSRRQDGDVPDRRRLVPAGPHLHAVPRGQSGAGAVPDRLEQGRGRHLPARGNPRRPHQIDRRQVRQGSRTGIRHPAPDDVAARNASKNIFRDATFAWGT
jgi:hypothetical protein